MVENKSATQRATLPSYPRGSSGTFLKWFLKPYTANKISELIHPKYRADIDGLRGLSVLYVVLFHSYPHWIEGYNLVHGGFIGVDIFFVISGFLIGTIILENLEKSTFSFFEFYSRRIRRIFPALLAVLAVSFVFGWFVLLPDEFKKLSSHILGGAGFVSNLILLGESGYFDEAADTKPLQHLWSLGIEEQFYIFEPFIILAAWRLKYNISICLIILITISFFLNISSVSADRVAAFYSPQTRFWELLCGTLLAWFTLHTRGNYKKTAVHNILSASGLTLIIIGGALITERSEFPGWFALLPVIGASAIIAGGTQSFVNKYLLGNSVLVWFGVISYPLYLWHWPLLVFLKISTDDYATSVTKRLIAVLLSIALAWLTYAFLEKKLRYGGTQCTYGLVLSMFFVAIIAVTATVSFIPPRQDDPSLEKIIQAKIDWQYPGSQFSVKIKNGLRYYTASGSEEKTLYIGDSNVEQYAPRINFLLKNDPASHNSAIIVGNQRNCALLREIIRDSGNRCDNEVDELESIIKNDSISTLVFAAVWPSYYEELIKGEKQFINFIKTYAANKRVFFILTIPSGKELSPDSLYTGNRFGKITAKDSNSVSFDINKFKAWNMASHTVLFRIAEQTGAIVIDPLDTFCKNGNCPILSSTGKPLYRDGLHITSSYARESATFIDQTLKSVTNHE